MSKKANRKRDSRWSRLQTLFEKCGEEFESLSNSQHRQADADLLVPLTAMLWHARIVIAATKASRCVGGAKSQDELLEGLKQFYIDYHRTYR